MCPIHIQSLHISFVPQLKCRLRLGALHWSVFTTDLRQEE
jgi:hypothetical protein